MLVGATVGTGTVSVPVGGIAAVRGILVRVAVAAAVIDGNGATVGASVAVAVGCAVKVGAIVGRAVVVTVSVLVVGAEPVVKIMPNAPAKTSKSKAVSMR